MTKWEILMGKFRLRASDVVLSVIDIQEKLSAVMPEEVLTEMVRKSGILMDAAEVLVFPVLVTEQYPKGLGNTVPALQERIYARSIPKFSKMNFSCCGEESFMKALEETGRNTVILCGQETHVCVLQTAIDLLDLDYEVYVAADAVCSRDKLHWQLALDELRQAGCVVEPVESMLFKMLGKAGGEEFKAISRLVK